MDLPARETLESAFQAYTGTLLFVSHDRYFLRQAAQSLLIFEEDSVHYYPFGYEHYVARCRDQKSFKDPAARIRAEEQALVLGLRSVPRAEHHRLQEISTEQAYEEWRFQAVLEPLSKIRLELEHWEEAKDPLREWEDDLFCKERMQEKEALNQRYTACCLAFYDLWLEFHPESSL